MVVLVAVRPLLPPGTLVVRRGLPSVVALRGAIAATFFATEIYLPYLLQEHYGLPPWLSGATLTVGALGWAGASQVQARLGARLDHLTALRIGAALLLAGIAGELVATALQLSPSLIGAAWVLAGAGMGLMFPRISAVVLAASTERDQGRNSAAMSISDAVGGATAISLAGLVFTAVGPASELAPFVAVLALTTRAGRSARCWSRGVRRDVSDAQRGHEHQHERGRRQQGVRRGQRAPAAEHVARRGEVAPPARRPSADHQEVAEPVDDEAATRRPTSRARAGGRPRRTPTQQTRPNAAVARWSHAVRGRRRQRHSRTSPTATLQVHATRARTATIRARYYVRSDNALLL